MSDSGITRRDDGLHIEGYPDAVAFVQVDGPKAKRLGHLALHGSDLRLALSFTQSLLDERHDDLVATALWHAAIVHFCKCFGRSASRAQLSPDKVFPSGDAREAYRYFDRLRDRHLVHDENDYSQAITGAVIGPESTAPNIQDVLALAISGRTFEPGVAQNLVNLAVLALRYVDDQIQQITRALAGELEAEGRENLLRRPPVSFRVPTTDDL